MTGATSYARGMDIERVLQGPHLPVQVDDHPGFVFIWASMHDQERAERWIDSGPGPLERICLSLGTHEYLFLGPDIARPAPRV